jgi:hypothetical protein
MSVIAVLLCACASDKKVPPPPQGVVLDVTQPIDLSRPRQLLGSLIGAAGTARKVDAYGTPESCSSVAVFYDRFMRDAHWSSLHEQADANGFAQSWKYMSRTSYIVGAPASNAGCTVITAIYSRAHRNRYEGSNLAIFTGNY